MKKRRILLVALVLFALGSAGALWAQETQEPAKAAAEQPRKRDITVGLIAAAAAIAVGLTALGTGLAQSRIGAAGAGTIAEKPEATGTIILLLAIPETMVILGFVVAIVMLFTL